MEGAKLFTEELSKSVAFNVGKGRGGGNAIPLHVATFVEVQYRALQATSQALKARAGAVREAWTEDEARRIAGGYDVDEEAFAHFWASPRGSVKQSAIKSAAKAFCKQPETITEILETAKVALGWRWDWMERGVIKRRSWMESQGNSVAAVAAADSPKRR